MKYAVTMPSLGADMDKGKLLEWHIKPGDIIHKGDLIAAVETQKAAVDIESFRAGTVVELIGQIDDIIPVGQVIATLEVAETATDIAAAPMSTAPISIVSASTPVVSIISPSAPTPAALSTPDSIVPAASAAIIQAPEQRVRISPMARRRANELAIDLQALTGTGRDGAIELRDVEQAFAAREKDTIASPTVTSPGPSLINVRAAIAQVMTRSKREIPHYYLQSQLSMDKLIQWLDNKNRQLAPEQRLLMPAVLMRAIVLALKTNPALNGSYENGVFTPRTEIHLGITVALKPEGVMTPAILDAQQLSLAELNSAFSDLVQRTRQGKLRNREMTEATVTVTNLGDLGADTVNGIIFAPQVALIGLGRIHQAAIVDADGGLRAGYVINASLAADHRVTDGLTGSKLLNSLGRLINQPEQLE